MIKLLLAYLFLSFTCHASTPESDLDVQTYRLEIIQDDQKEVRFQIKFEIDFLLKTLGNNAYLDRPKNADGIGIFHLNQCENESTELSTEKLILHKKCLKTGTNHISGQYFVHADSNETGLIKTEFGWMTKNWPDGARRWLIGNDHVTDVAKWIIKLQVSQGYTGVASGQKINSSPLAFQTTLPLAPYQIGWTIGKLHSQNWKSHIEIFDLESSTSDLDWLENIHAELADMNRMFPPTSGPIRVLRVSEPGDFETANLITLHDSHEALHEIIHQSWGISVKPRNWSDLWISESFTTFLTGYLRTKHGKKFYQCDPSRGTIFVPGVNSPLKALNEGVYCQGAFALLELRNIFAGYSDGNDELFDRFLIMLYEEAKSKSFTTWQMLDLIQAVSKKIHPTIVSQVWSWEKKWFIDSQFKPMYLKLRVRNILEVWKHAIFGAS